MAIQKVVISGTVLEIYDQERRSYGKSADYNSVDSANPSHDPLSRFSSSISRSRLSIRRLIDCNLSSKDPAKFVTFTFADNVTDLSRANYLWKIFLKDLRRRLGYAPKYITVVEFQKRGAVHYHSIFFDLPLVFGERHFLRSWKNGFISVRRINRIRSIGGYLSKYLTKETLDDRLTGQKAYFTSRSLLKPITYVYNRSRITLSPYPLFHDEHIGTYNLVQESTRQYSSPYTGSVNYARYKIIST